MNARKYVQAFSNKMGELDSLYHYKIQAKRLIPTQVGAEPQTFIRLAHSFIDFTVTSKIQSSFINYI